MPLQTSLQNKKNLTCRFLLKSVWLCLENDASGLKWKWTSVKAGGLRPAARSGVSLTIAANGKGYIFGGVQDTDEDDENLAGLFSNEMHSLDLASQSWRPIELLGKKEKKSGKSKAGDVSDDDMDSSAPQKDGKQFFSLNFCFGEGKFSYGTIFFHLYSVSDNGRCFYDDRWRW